MQEYQNIINVNVNFAVNLSQLSVKVFCLTWNVYLRFDGIKKYNIPPNIIYYKDDYETFFENPWKQQETLL